MCRTVRAAAIAIVGFLVILLFAIGIGLLSAPGDAEHTTAPASSAEE